jgi:hypothetical protein
MGNEYGLLMDYHNAGNRIVCLYADLSCKADPDFVFFSSAHHLTVMRFSNLEEAIQTAKIMSLKLSEQPSTQIGIGDEGIFLNHSLANQSHRLGLERAISLGIDSTKKEVSISSDNITYVSVVPLGTGNYSFSSLKKNPKSKTIQFGDPIVTFASKTRTEVKPDEGYKVPTEDLERTVKEDNWWDPD